MANYSSRLKGFKPGSTPAITILIITVLTLVVLDYTDRMQTGPLKPAGVAKDVRAPESSKTKGADRAARQNQQALNSKIPDPLNHNLAKVIDAAKKAPFRARIVTETGLKGYWTQSGDSYRFEDPAKQNLIIFNAKKKRVWVVNTVGKIAIETPVATSAAGTYVDLSPAFFVAGFSDTATAGTRSLEAMLPATGDAKLIFTKQGLPQHWEGPKSDGKNCFIRWEYMQINNISPAEFELPSGLTVTQSQLR